MKIVVLSSLAQDSGCYLRARYMADALKPMAEVRFLKPLFRSLPFMADMLLSVPYNILRVLLSDGDVYIGIKPFPNVTLPLIIKKMLTGKKIVVDIDDLDSGYRKGWLSAVSHLVQKPFPAYFDLITYHNKRLEPYIQRTFSVNKDRLYRLKQGVDTSVFSPGSFDRKLRQRFPEGNKIIVYTGHLNAASDLEEILRAMKLVFNRFNRKPVTFIVAGGGPDEDRFRNFARKTGVPAYFTGRISHTRVASYISIADICLVYYRDIPVNYYRSSMKLRECLAMNKQVITDNVGELKQFKTYTYQTKPDIVAYAGKIIELLTGKTDQRENAGRDLVRRTCDWNSLGRQFYKRLDRLLHTSGKAEPPQPV